MKPFTLELSPVAPRPGQKIELLPGGRQNVTFRGTFINADDHSSGMVGKIITVAGKRYRVKDYDCRTGVMKLVAAD